MSHVTLNKTFQGAVAHKLSNSRKLKVLASTKPSTWAKCEVKVKATPIIGGEDGDLAQIRLCGPQVRCCRSEDYGEFVQRSIVHWRDLADPSMWVVDGETRRGELDHADCWRRPKNKPPSRT